MKKLITSFVIAFATLSAKAEHNSILKLKMFDNGIFSVVLDERPSCSPSNSFSMEHIKAGSHRLKVVRYWKNPYGTDPAGQVVYRGWVDIPPRSIVYANINCHNQFDVIRVESMFCPSEGGGYSWHDEGEQHEGGVQQGSSWGNPVPPMPMSPAGFLQMKNLMISNVFDGTRLDIAREALGCNFFTSAQIEELAGLFSFEASRLEFAKLAYRKTIDKQNYFLVNYAFTFASSVRELNEYIGRN